MMKSFFIYNSSVKNYILLILGILMMALLIAIFYKGGLKIDFVLATIAGYFVIFFVLKNYRFPLIPEVKEDSDDHVVYARCILLVVFLLSLFVLMIGELL